MSSKLNSMMRLFGSRRQNSNNTGSIDESSKKGDSIIDRKAQERNPDVENSIKKYLDYIMKKNDLDEIISDYKYSKYIHKLSELLYAVDKMHIHVFAILEFSKVVEYFITMLNLTKDCSCTAIIEYYGRKLTKNEQIHKHHILDECMRGNHIFYAVISIVTAMTDISRVFCQIFNDKGGITFLFDYLSNENFLSNSILHNYLENPYNERNTDHVLNLIKNAISIVQNLSRTIKINKKIAANIMLSFSKNLKFQEEHSIISYMFLAKIMREKGNLLNREGVLNSKMFI